MTDESRIPTNLRTLLILEIVGNSDKALSPTEINQHIGLPKQTMHRLCATLVEEGFLIYEPSGKRLRPARRLRSLGVGMLYASHIHIGRRQILKNVAQTLGETVNFVVPSDDGMTYLDRVETDWPIRVQLPVGTHVPFHCTASGKVFLASLAPAMRERLVRSLQLKPYTSNTFENADKLLESLETIVSQGYAIDDQEFMDGMVAIAVPIFDEKKRFLAALATHGPTVRLDPEILVQHKTLLSNAARQLARALVDE
ncbi:IclR family transcriptional regulator [Ahrensia kielensis]|uniref:IclR family transcriptional regulator n=1 Tax=Ahrensia kielensis TaxID=76980 RepID=UPI00036D4802|nr:IclR family transcriptional regulator [Ahrensia kielensis]